MTKKNIYLVSDVDKARELEAYVVSTKDAGFLHDWRLVKTS